MHTHMQVGEVGNASTELLATIEEKSEPLGNRDAAWALLTTHDKRPGVCACGLYACVCVCYVVSHSYPYTTHITLH
jgi:hypothetical protein